jgi:hypothetical protein
MPGMFSRIIRASKSSTSVGRGRASSTPWGSLIHATTSLVVARPPKGRRIRELAEHRRTDNVFVRHGIIVADVAHRPARVVVVVASSQQRAPSAARGARGGG